MKFATVATIITATVGLAAAQPHGHSHRHVHKHAARDDVITVYELNGQVVSAKEVQEGIRNGSLVLASGGTVVQQPPSSPATPAPVPEVTVSTSVEPKPHHHHHGQDSPDHDGHGFPNAPATVNVDFPDGEIDCSTFPSDYGAVPLHYLGLDGWSGIQKPSIVGHAFGAITTVTKETCGLTGSCCSGDNTFCSYNCPPGFQKSQWPLIQGSSGESIGGLQCMGGKLHLTNPQLSKKLCIKGTDKVKVFVKNTMAEGASICRTDYPGTESETLPVNAAAGATEQLACPDADTYYHWQNAATSAQYYANPAGVPIQQACEWGNPSKPWGNYAPLNLGVGYKNGSAWLSIFQNKPTTLEKLDYNIELVGNHGGYDNMIGRCMYKNGQYCSGDDYTDCNDDGCTVNVSSGTATYVLTAA